MGNPLRQPMNPNLMGSGIPGPINQPMQQPMPQQGSQMNPMQTMIFNMLYNKNPQFRQFADSMRGKTPEQAFQENGLDYNQYRNIGPEQIYNNMMGMN